MIILGATVKSVRSHHLVFASILVIVLGSLSGCVSKTETALVPVEAIQKVVLFDRYWIEIDGFKERKWDYFLVRPHFLVPPTDTAMAYTIPRLAIDSICFESQCLGSASPYCLESSRIDYAKLAPYQVWLENVQSYLVKDSKVASGEWSEPESDLRFIGDDCAIDPINFPCTDFLRLHCSKQEVTAVFYARLLDRRTGKVVDNTVKRVPYVIKVKSRLKSVGDF